MAYFHVRIFLCNEIYITNIKSLPTVTVRVFALKHGCGRSYRLCQTWERVGRARGRSKYLITPFLNCVPNYSLFI